MKGRDGQVSASSQSRQKRPRTKVILSPDFPLALCPLELNSRQAPISIVQGTCHCSLTREECFSKEARTDLPLRCSLPSPHSCWNKQKAVPTVQLELQVGCPSYDPSKHGHCQAGRVSPPGGASPWRRRSFTLLSAPWELLDIGAEMLHGRGSLCWILEIANDGAPVGPKVRCPDEQIATDADHQVLPQIWMGNSGVGAQPSVV